MSCRQQLYQARVWSIRLCSCRRVVNTSLLLLPAFTCAQTRRGLYRFPIGGLSSWSLGRGGEDSHLIYSPPPELGSGDKDTVTHLKTLCLGRARVCPSHMRLSDVHFSLRAFVLMSDAAVCRCRGDGRSGADLPHPSARLRPVVTPGCHCLRVNDAQTLVDLCKRHSGEGCSTTASLKSLKKSRELSFPVTPGRRNFKIAAFFPVTGDNTSEAASDERLIRHAERNIWWFLIFCLHQEHFYSYW